MTVDQFIYTSAVHGELGYPGFQVWAKSAGLTPQEREQALRHINYTRPRGLPEKPDRTAIERDFPRALRWVPLPSGRHLLALVSYTGAELLPGDGDPRGGNFLAHALLVSNLPPEIWPIDWLEWPDWRTWLDKTEDENRYATPLSQPDLGGFTGAESFTLPELTSFISDRQDGVLWLTTMLRAVVHIKSPDIKTPIRQILIRDQHLNLSFWVAAITKCLPWNCMTQLSFSTYSHGLGDGTADIIGTGDHTDFMGTDYETDAQYYAFDVLQQHMGKAAADLSRQSAQNDYAALVVHWLQTDPERLAEFHNFLRIFDLPTISTALEYPLALYRLVTAEAVDIESNHLVEVLNFVNQHTQNSQARGDFFTVLADAVINLVGRVNLQRLEIIFRFLVTAARETGAATSLNRVYDLWVDLLERELKQQDTLQQTRTALAVFQDVFGKEPEALATRVTAAERLDIIQTHLGFLAVESQQWLFENLLRWLQQCYGPNYWQQPALEAIVKTLVDVKRFEEARLVRVLTPFSNQSAALSAMVKTVWQELQTAPVDSNKQAEYVAALGHSLEQILGRASAVMAQEVRKSVDTNAFVGLLPGTLEYLITDEYTRTPSAAALMQRVHTCYPIMYQAHLGFVILSVFQKLKTEKAAAEILRLLEKVFADGTVTDLNEAHQHRLLQIFNQYVSLAQTSTSASSAVDQALKLLKDNHELLNPNRLAVYQALLHLPYQAFPAQEVLNLLDHWIRRLSDTDYRIVVEMFFKHGLFNAATDRVQHERLLNILYHSDHIKLLAQQYQAWLKTRIPPHTRGLDAAITFWLMIDPFGNAAKALKPHLYALLVETVSQAEILRLLEKLFVDGKVADLSEAHQHHLLQTFNQYVNLSRPSSSASSAVDQALQLLKENQKLLNPNRLKVYQALLHLRYQAFPAQEVLNELDQWIRHLADTDYRIILEVFFNKHDVFTAATDRGQHDRLLKILHRSDHIKLLVKHYQAWLKTRISPDTRGGLDAAVAFWLTVDPFDNKANALKPRLYASLVKTVSQLDDKTVQKMGNAFQAAPDNQHVRSTWPPFYQEVKAARVTFLQKVKRFLSRSNTPDTSE